MSTLAPGSPHERNDNLAPSPQCSANSRRNRSCDTKAQIVEPKSGGAPEPAGGAEALGSVVPGTAADNPARTIVDNPRRAVRRRSLEVAVKAVLGRVGMWRGGCRLNISVAASFVWRCLSGSTVTPFPHSAHRTGQAGLPHPALGQNFTPSPTARRVQAGPGVRARSAHRGARVDRSRPCVA